MAEPLKDLLTYEQFVELYGKRPPDIAYNMAIYLARPIIEREERERIQVWGPEPCPHFDGYEKRECTLCWEDLFKGE